MTARVFSAYVRSKQKVQDKVGPLEGGDGNIITKGFLMVENLNEYFSSVFTREDISAGRVRLFRTTIYNPKHGS